MENLELKKSDLESNTITFTTDNNVNEIIKLCGNGDIFVKGKLVENDLEVVEGMREFLNRTKPKDWGSIYAEYCLDMVNGVIPQLPFSDSSKTFDWFKSKLNSF